MLAMALGGGAIYMMLILLHAMQRKLTGGSQADGELEELRDRVAELEGQIDDLAVREPEQHLAELEERLEFAERLLANEKNRATLPEPSDEVTAASQDGVDRVG
jgi:predicted  nucleic acid-binding Zn-ribbon protein